MKKKHRILRLLAVATMAVMLIGTTCVPAAAAQETKATTMKLEKTENTVSVTNANGKALTLKDGAKLYNGYTIKTSAASYAWLSLDSKTVIKMDAFSKVSIQKSGKKIKVKLDKGQLFFNVKEHLASDEDLELCTSNMTTGVRGTSGELASEEGGSSSQLNLYSGQTTVSWGTRITIINPGILFDFTMPSGLDIAIPDNLQKKKEEFAPINLDMPDTPDGRIIISDFWDSGSGVGQIDVKKFSVSDAIKLKPYIGIEVKGDKGLQDQLINEQGNDFTAEDRDEISKTVDEQLQQVNEQQKQKLQETNEKLKEEVKVDIAEPLKPIAPSNSGGGGGSSSSSLFNTYTVSFMNGEKNSGLFADISIANNQLVPRPFLQPKKNGYWYDSALYSDDPNAKPEEFVFNKPITRNTTLYWRDQSDQPETN